MSCRSTLVKRRRRYIINLIAAALLLAVRESPREAMKISFSIKRYVNIRHSNMCGRDRKAKYTERTYFIFQIFFFEIRKKNLGQKLTFFHVTGHFGPS